MNECVIGRAGGLVGDLKGRGAGEDLRPDKAQRPRMGDLDDGPVAVLAALCTSLFWVGP